MKGAIYHFTDGSTQKPIVYQKQVTKLEQFAQKAGVDVEKTYVDFSLKKSEQPEFNAFLMDSHLYSALVVKDFYHINKNTSMCMKMMRKLLANNVTIYTLENGSFDFTTAPFEKPLRVTTYTHVDGNIRDVDNTIQLQQDIYNLFIKRKTKWKLIEHYSDICHLQNDAEQKNLMRLIEDSDKYDIILVNNLNDIHWRTSRFCKIREEIGKPIFSLQDGYLMYKKEELI